MRLWPGARESRPGRRFRRNVSGTGRVSVCFFGEGALGQGVLYEVMNLAAALEAAGDLRLREQSVHRVHALFGDDGRRYSGARVRRSACRRGERGRPGCARRATRRRPRTGIERAREGAGAGVFSLQYLSLQWAPRRRHQPRVLSVEAGRAAWANERDPIQTSWRAGWWSRELRTRSHSYGFARRLPRR